MEVRFQRLLPIIIAIVTISRRHLDDDFGNNSLINKADQEGEEVKTLTNFFLS
jgi:hypothetical protein